jgi:hypothetical protein
MSFECGHPKDIQIAKELFNNSFGAFFFPFTGFSHLVERCHKTVKHCLDFSFVFSAHLPA